jgi:hypothetical protein
MRRIPGRRQEQQRRLTAYVTDQRVPDLERGWIMLALTGHASVYLLLTGANTAWIAGMAVRVWRRRKAGLTGAVRAEVRRPGLGALLAANLVYASLRALLLAVLERRARDLGRRPSR